MHYYENDMLRIATLVDVDSGNETPKQHDIQYTPVQQKGVLVTKTQTKLKSEKPLKSGEFRKILKGNPLRPWHTRTQLEFIDHVVLIWLNRARRGDQGIEMPDSILKAKAKEAAMLINKYAEFYPKTWLPAFKMKLKLAYDLKPQRYIQILGYPTMIIAGIIREEWPKFFGNKNLSRDSDEESPMEILGVGQVEAVELDQREVVGEKQVKEVINNKDISTNAAEIVELSDDSDEEISNDPIQTYDEALDCLKLVDGFALCVRNFKAVALISQIEDILKNQQGS